MLNIMENNNSVPFNISQQSNNEGGTGSSSTNCFPLKLPLIVVSLFVVLMLIIFIAWLVMNPHNPGFRLTSLSVTNFNFSDSKLTGDYNVGLTVINPNKKVQAVLDHFNVWVCYDEVELSEPTVSGSPTAPATYPLEKMSYMNLTFPLKSRDSPLKMKHKKVYEDLSAHLKKGILNLNVKVQVSIKFVAGNWPSEEKLLEVYCGDLDVFFSDKAKRTGRLLGIGKDCRVSVQ